VEVKEQQTTKIKEINDEYEKKLQNLSGMDNDSPKEPENSEFSKIFEQQVEENNSLRDAIRGLINQNPEANSFNIEEKDKQLDQANEMIEKLTQKCLKIEKKYKETKVYYRLFKHTELIQ
jgi:hypothetical protein